VFRGRTIPPAARDGDAGPTGYWRSKFGGDRPSSDSACWSTARREIIGVRPATFRFDRKAGADVAATDRNKIVSRRLRFTAIARLKTYVTEATPTSPG
jgi:hypothetical protein